MHYKHISDPRGQNQSAIVTRTSQMMEWTDVKYPNRN